MLKIDLITGFLGSGKTTFLLKYAHFLLAKGMRIGVLEYDYGAVNIDMVLLGGLRGDNCELEMIDASCDRDGIVRRLRTKLIAMAMSGYERVILEPSGVFDMDIFFDILSEEPLDRLAEIGSIITVVNAKLKENLSPEADYILASQAASAGAVVLSRVQLADALEIRNTKEHIARAAERIKCTGYRESFVEKSFDDFTEDDFTLFMNCGYRENACIKTIAGNESEFSTVYIMDSKLTLSELKERISTLLTDSVYGHVVRVKGFVRDGGVNYLLNITEYEESIRPIGRGQSIVIVIGDNLNRVKIEEYLK